MDRIRWIFIAIFFLVTLIFSFDLGRTGNNLMPILSTLAVLIVASLHGTERYGAKNTLVFFLITWVVAFPFEVLSLNVGFPFGHYYYDQLGGPRIFQVPLVLMVAYFNIAYISWIVSHVLLRQYSQKLIGRRIFLIPLIGTFIMVMWDLCMDPIASTIDSLWVWKGGGPYFGVPLQNYFGWFLVIYLVLQIFALYISKYDKGKQSIIFSKKSFWMEAPTLFGIQGALLLLPPFTVSAHKDIYGPMALVAILTMVFISILSFITIYDSKELY